MRPRNLPAIIAALAATAVTLPAVADATSSRGCARAGGNCSERKLDGKHYMKMELARSRWVRTSLFMASFRFSNLYDSSFRGARLRRADLSFGNRAWSDFRNADLTLSDLSRSDFYNSDFSGADLRGARIVGTRFDRSDLTDADFEGAFLKDSSFQGIKLCRTTQPNGTVRNDDCAGNGGENGKPGGGGDCCFPGDRGRDDGGKGKGKGKGNGTGNGNGKDSEDDEATVDEDDDDTTASELRSLPAGPEPGR